MAAFFFIRNVFKPYKGDFTVKYFKLGDALKELTSANGAKDTAAAGAKLLGKTLFNAGKLIVDETPALNEKMSKKILEEKEDLTDEQRRKYEDINQRSKILRIKGEIKRLEEQVKDEETPEDEKKRLEWKVEDLKRDLSKC
jgi:polyhydroxyalkanoate synthesis regulator phasin